MSAPKTSPPDATRVPGAAASGGEHHDTPIWDAEFAERWDALRTVEDWRECVHGAPGPCERCGSSDDEEPADA